MSGALQADVILWRVSLALTGVLLVRILASGLWRQYPGATFYLAFTFARSLTLQFLTWSNRRGDPFASEIYPAVYLYTLPLLWAGYFGVVYEIYTGVLAGYKGLSVLSRRTLTVAVLGSLLVSVITLWPDLNYADEIWKQLRTTILIDRAIVFALLLFLVLNALFLAWYPIPLKRNLLVYSFVFACLFFSVAGASFYRNLLGHEWHRLASAAMMGANCLCLLVWLLSWSRAGERVVSFSLVPRDPQAQQRLLDQLAHLNAILERRPIGR
jgi:hypothetical protein